MTTAARTCGAGASRWRMVALDPYTVELGGHQGRAMGGALGTSQAIGEGGGMTGNSAALSARSCADTASQTQAYTLLSSAQPSAALATTIPLLLIPESPRKDSHSSLDQLGMGPLSGLVR